MSEPFAFADVSVSLPAALLEEIDRTRGDVARHEYLSGLITAAIAQDAPAVAEQLGRSDSGAGEWRGHVGAVEIGGFSEGRLVLRLPGFKIHPQPSEHCEEYPGEIDVMLDERRGVVCVGMSGEAARVLAYWLLATSAEHEWRVARKREQRAAKAVAELRELHAQWHTIKVRRARGQDARCDLVFADDGHAQSDRLANAQRLIERELRRRRATANGQVGSQPETAAGCVSAGSGEW